MQRKEELSIIGSYVDLEAMTKIPECKEDTPHAAVI